MCCPDRGPVQSGCTLAWAAGAVALLSDKMAHPWCLRRVQAFADENCPDEDAAAEEKALREQREKRMQGLQVSGLGLPPASI